MRNDFPISEEASNEVISLPMNPFLNDKQINYVISLVTDKNLQLENSIHKK